jgi:hypothetical protein
LLFFIIGGIALFFVCVMCFTLFCFFTLFCYVSFCFFIFVSVMCFSVSNSETKVALAVSKNK